MPQDIPIDLAREVSEKSGFPMIVVYGFDSDGSEHVTTYGVTDEQSANAAAVGNWFKVKIGWPENMAVAESAKVKALKDRIAQLEEVIRLLTNPVPEQEKGGVS